ncbi:MAG: TetR/AcrR family transcriptional regulator [Oscillospiraceae bacterium]|nr:TetR/AcrR family transcriptional regulator [Oscillospiraceae bacterium]
MEKENEARERLIACAKKEFLEKGFSKASLRSISAAADMTTGAVYFFCKDKNGLLGAVVDEPLQKLMNAIQEHFSEDLSADIASFQHKAGDHDDFAEMMISLLYDNRDALLILLEKSAGSSYEGIVDDLVELIERHNYALAEKYAAAFPGKRINDYMLHWLAHVEINAYVHLITHEADPERALKEIKPVMDMLVEGWMAHILEDAD